MFITNLWKSIDQFKFSLNRTTLCISSFYFAMIFLKSSLNFLNVYFFSLLESGWRRLKKWPQECRQNKIYEVCSFWYQKTCERVFNIYIHLNMWRMCFSRRNIIVLRWYFLWLSSCMSVFYVIKLGYQS